MEGDSRRKEKEQSCSLGQILCCFIRFSVNQLVFARTGVRRGVSKRARARREIKRMGITSCPGPSLCGHHLYKFCEGNREEVSRGQPP